MCIVDTHTADPSPAPFCVYFTPVSAHVRPPAPGVNAIARRAESTTLTPLTGTPFAVIVLASARPRRSPPTKEALTALSTSPAVIRLSTCGLAA